MMGGGQGQARQVAASGPGWREWRASISRDTEQLLESIFEEPSRQQQQQLTNTEWKKWSNNQKCRHVAGRRRAQVTRWTMVGRNILTAILYATGAWTGITATGRLDLPGSVHVREEGSSTSTGHIAVQETIPLYSGTVADLLINLVSSKATMDHSQLFVKDLDGRTRVMDISLLGTGTDNVLEVTRWHGGTEQ